MIIGHAFSQPLSSPSRRARPSGTSNAVDNDDGRRIARPTSAVPADFIHKGAPHRRSRSACFATDYPLTSEVCLEGGSPYSVYAWR